MSTFTDKLRQYGVLRTIQFAFSELIQKYYYQAVLGSYSQTQEDLLLDRLTGRKAKGFYVDVGAYDPFRFSNTMRFYKRGWRGINIEPNTENWKRFKKHRARDINLNVGVGNKKGALLFYSIDPPTLSTFSSRQAAEYKKQNFKILSKKSVKVVPLGDILKKHAADCQIDFLSMDVEGFEISALRGNDWKRFRPTILCIEATHGKTVENYLQTVGYKKISDNGLNAFYKDIYE